LFHVDAASKPVKSAKGENKPCLSLPYATLFQAYREVAYSSTVSFALEKRQRRNSSLQKVYKFWLIGKQVVVNGPDCGKNGSSLEIGFNRFAPIKRLSSYDMVPVDQAFLIL